MEASKIVEKVTREPETLEVRVLRLERLLEIAQADIRALRVLAHKGQDE